MPDHRQPSTTAIVVHFGSLSSTERTLRSLDMHAPGVPVVVVDNDGALVQATAERAVRGRFALLSPGRNLGYGAACNLAAKSSVGEYLLFLNNDVELDPETLPRLREVLDREPRVAAVAPRLRDASGRPVASIGRAPTPRRILFENLFLPRLFPGIAFFHGHHTARICHSRPRDVETLLGAVFLIRRAAFDEVGGFDERYFFFVEETDLFERLRQRGWRIRFDPASMAIHHGGIASRDIDRQILDRWLDAGFRTYAREHHGPRGERRTVRALYAGALLRWLLSHVQPGPARLARRRRYSAICAMYREELAAGRPPEGAQASREEPPRPLSRK
ncbi:MAG: glycosyltransferase family 2 protein [Thermoanaerobaculia bacterium]